MKKKVVSVLVVAMLLLGMISGCGSISDEPSVKNEPSAKVDEEVATPDQVVELNYWTWFPSEAQLKETIANFESENPNIKINLTVMESATYRDKVTLALNTGEDIDIIGVQPNTFATSVQDYLVDLEEYMPTVLGDDWLGSYDQATLDKGKSLTGGKAKFITILNSGSMIGFYNATLLKEIGKEVPTTIADYKDVAEALYAKYPDKLAGVFAGLETWVVDEMMLTILSQQGDYYNKWVYENAPLNSQEYIDAIAGFKKFFDEGIFSQDVMDLDYGSATEVFTNGNALVYYMGSWEAPLLSSVLREQNGIKLEDVGVMALPVVKEGGKPAVNAFLDCGVGIVAQSEKKEAAAKFVQYISSGAGVNSLAKQFAGTPGTTDFVMDESMLTSEAAKKGWDLMLELMKNAPADRVSIYAFAKGVEGPAIQSVINGTMKPEEAVEKMQKEWDTGTYK